MRICTKNFTDGRVCENVMLDTSCGALAGTCEYQSDNIPVDLLEDKTGAIRIIPDDSRRFALWTGDYVYHERDTIVLTDDQWNEIQDGYIGYICEFGRLHRPASWVSIWDALQFNEKRRFEMFMSFSQYLRELLKLRKWLDEPCDKHPKSEYLPCSRDSYGYYAYEYIYPEHRKDCPQCMAELEKQK